MAVIVVRAPPKHYRMTPISVVEARDKPFVFFVIDKDGARRAAYRAAGSARCSRDTGEREERESLMGWFGTLFVGAVIGFIGEWMQGGWRLGRLGWSALIAAMCALMMKMIGNIVGMFDDGSSLEWLASVLAAIIAVTVYGSWNRRAARTRARH